jgi:hypothetical protein
MINPWRIAIVVSVPVWNVREHVESFDHDHSILGFNALGEATQLDVLKTLKILFFIVSDARATYFLLDCVGLSP